MASQQVWVVREKQRLLLEARNHDSQAEARSEGCSNGV